MLMVPVLVIGAESGNNFHPPNTLPNSVSVHEMVIATDVQKLKPVGVDQDFPSTVGRLFCYTRVASPRAETKIHHLWFYGDRLVQVVLLPVKGFNYRTYSLRPIPPEWTGSWRVDLTTEDGTLLKSVSFTIR
jgi:hypothetical protein